MRCSPCTVAPVPRRGFYLVGNKKPTRKVGWIARMQVGGAGAKQSRFYQTGKLGSPILCQASQCWRSGWQKLF